MPTAARPEPVAFTHGARKPAVDSVPHLTSIRPTRRARNPSGPNQFLGHRTEQSAAATEIRTGVMAIDWPAGSGVARLQRPARAGSRREER